MYDMVVEALMATRTLLSSHFIRAIYCLLITSVLNNFFDAVKRICFIINGSLLFNISPSSRTTRAPLGALVPIIIH